MGHDVFISYSNRDKTIADAACARLERAGHRCWIAPRDVGGGEWGKAIVEAIRGARVFVLIFSAEANRSPQVNREVERAVSNGLPIIPLRIENIAPSDSLEYFISNQHWLDALTRPIARHLDHLAEVVERLLGGGTAPPPLPPAATTSAGRRTVAIMFAAGMAAIVGGAVWTAVQRAGPGLPASPTTSVQAENGAQAEVDEVAAPAPAPSPQDENLLDFPTVRMNDTSYGWLDAQPLLRDAAIPVRVVEISAAGGDLGGGRLGFVASDALVMQGLTVQGPTRTMLVYRRDVDPYAVLRASMAPATPLPPQVPNSVVLEFEEPVAQVRFSIPAVQPDSSLAGVTIRAFSTSGEEIQSVARNPVSSGNLAPAQSVTLTGWRRQGIHQVRFEPNHVSTGRYGSGTGFLIDGITIRRMANPPT